jgi:hypothetical protein
MEVKYLGNVSKLKLFRTQRHKKEVMPMLKFSTKKRNNKELNFLTFQINLESFKMNNSVIIHISISTYNII